MGRRLRVLAGLTALAELVVFILVAAWIGVGWTILATLATSAVGLVLLGRQGTRALAELRERARTRRHPGRALGDAGLVALGGGLMLLPGFLGDLVGLLCLLPGTRGLMRALLARVLISRLPDRMRGPVQVISVRTGQVGPTSGSGATRVPPPLIRGRVIEGQVVDGEVVDGAVVDGAVVREPGPGRPPS